MPYGLQVMDGAGRIKIDTSRSFTRIFGAINIPLRSIRWSYDLGTDRHPELVQSGSIQDGRLQTGDPFYFTQFYCYGQVIPADPTGRARVSEISHGFTPPVVTVSGPTLTWSYDIENVRSYGDPGWWCSGGLYLYYGVY